MEVYTAITTTVACDWCNHEEYLGDLMSDDIFEIQRQMEQDYYWAEWEGDFICEDCQSNLYSCINCDSDCVEDDAYFCDGDVYCSKDCALPAHQDWFEEEDDEKNCDECGLQNPWYHLGPKEEAHVAWVLA